MCFSQVPPPAHPPKSPIYEGRSCASPRPPPPAHLPECPLMKAPPFSTPLLSNCVLSPTLKCPFPHFCCLSPPLPPSCCCPFSRSPSRCTTTYLPISERLTWQTRVVAVTVVPEVLNCSHVAYRTVVLEMLSGCVLNPLSLPRRPMMVDCYRWGPVRWEACWEGLVPAGTQGLAPHSRFIARC